MEHMSARGYFSLLSLLIILSILAGCTEAPELRSVPGLSGASIGVIVENPEQYLGKEVKVKGKLIILWGILEQDRAYLEDENGYRIELRLPGKVLTKGWDLGNRMLYAGEVYSMAGKVMSYEVCDCQYKYSDSDYWKDMIGKNPLVVEECLIPPQALSKGVYKEYRCKPGTVMTKYYLDVGRVE
ncbi:hypothetical protein [Candidatus Pyrohabitans sp.]